MGFVMLISVLDTLFTLFTIAFAASIPIAVVMYFLLGASLPGTYLVFSGWAYLAFMPFTVLVFCTLENKRAWFGRQQPFKCLDGSMHYYDKPESLGFTNMSEKVFGVIYWPWTWLFLRQKETDPLGLPFN
ncbi:MAG TPA: hypothetical protein VN420_05735 [Candidatus Fimivivens sp.]|nr:hypothetical protein [Candidatus Fimivivens sp.]